jgi:hypothetical protein
MPFSIKHFMRAAKKPSSWLTLVELGLSLETHDSATQLLEELGIVVKLLVRQVLEKLP